MKQADSTISRWPTRLKKWAKVLNIHLTRENRPMTSKHTKRCSSDEKVNIKTTIIYHYTTIRMAEIQNTDSTKCWLGCRATGTFIHCWWECKMVQPLWKIGWQFLWRLNIYFSHDSIITLLGIYPNVFKIYTHTKTNTEIVVPVYSPPLYISETNPSQYQKSIDSWIKIWSPVQTAG